MLLAYTFFAGLPIKIGFHQNIIFILVINVFNTLLIYQHPPFFIAWFISKYFIILTINLKNLFFFNNPNSVRYKIILKWVFNNDVHLKDVYTTFFFNNFCFKAFIARITGFMHSSLFCLLVYFEYRRELLNLETVLVKKMDVYVESLNLSNMHELNIKEYFETSRTYKVELINDIFDYPIIYLFDEIFFKAFNFLILNLNSLILKIVINFYV